MGVQLGAHLASVTFIFKITAAAVLPTIILMGYWVLVGRFMVGMN